MLQKNKLFKTSVKCQQMLERTTWLPTNSRLLGQGLNCLVQTVQFSPSPVSIGPATLSHNTDVISKGLGGVPWVIDHTAHSFETPKCFLSCFSILVQPILEEAKVCELNLSPSLLDVAFQLLCELQEPIRFDAIWAFQGKEDKKEVIKSLGYNLSSLNYCSL